MTSDQDNATQGWTVERGHYNTSSFARTGEWYIADYHDSPGTSFVVSPEGRWYRMMAEDADLILAALQRPTTDKLNKLWMDDCEERDKLKAENKLLEMRPSREAALLQALRTYGEHQPPCKPHGMCTCGFAALISPPGLSEGTSA